MGLTLLLYSLEPMKVFSVRIKSTLASGCEHSYFFVLGILLRRTVDILEDTANQRCLSSIHQR